MQDDYLKRRIFYLCLCLAVPLVSVFALSEGGQRLSSGMLGPFARAWQYVISKIMHYCGSSDEESAISRENHYYELLDQKRNFERLKEENRQLRQMLGLSAPMEFKAIHAEVVGRDPVNWNWEFWVNCGQEQGVHPGDCVVVNGALVGRVQKVHGERSKVATLVSPNCKAGVLVRNANGTEYPGILMGRGHVNGNPGIGCHVEYLAKDVAIQAGDKVFTSGLGNEIPYGIPVGNAIPDEQHRCPSIIDHARARVCVAPEANVAKLSFVTIYIRFADRQTK